MNAHEPISVIAFLGDAGVPPDVGPDEVALPAAVAKLARRMPIAIVSLAGAAGAAGAADAAGPVRVCLKAIKTAHVPEGEVRALCVNVWHADGA